MTPTLSPELTAQIEQEADDIILKLNDDNDYQAGVINGYGNGYKVAGEKYALKFEQAEQQLEQMAKAMLYISNGGATPIRKANQALTDYNNYLKQGEDDSDNG
jgi:hypothetical protein